MPQEKKKDGSVEAVKLPIVTTSVCPECLKIITATIFEDDGKIWIKKKCDEHGEVVELYWGSADMFKRASTFAYDGRGVENPNVAKANPVCPKDCGLCSLHKSHTALANLVVTNRCDLNCWYCFFFAKRAGYVYEPSLEELRKAVKLLRDEKPVPGNALQITGGEPSLRNDILDIIKMTKEEGVEHVQYNTNGIRFSQDPEFVAKLRESGINTVYLSFDGVTPQTNPKNHYEIPQVLENSRKAGVGLVLVPTIIKGVNDSELGDILRFGFRNMDVVRGVNYQPVSLVGRMPRKERDKHRITIPDVIQRIEEQTGGAISKDDFYPVPSMKVITDFVESLVKKPQYSLSTHFACGMATYVFEDNGKMLPITRFIDLGGLFEYVEEQAGELQKGKSKYVVGAKMLFRLNSFIDKDAAPKGFSLGKIIYDALMKHDYSSLGAFHRKSLFVGMMHFMDLYNYDIERVKRCCIHYLTPEAIIPFCAFNVIPEWYRDSVQNKYGVSFEDWEKTTGRTMRSDMYQHDAETLKNSELYRKTYEGFLKE